MTTYLQNLENDTLKRFVAIEDLHRQLNLIVDEWLCDGGNIFIDPTFTETISDFYKAVLRVLIEQKEPTTAIEYYIMEKVRDYEVFNH